MTFLEHKLMRSFYFMKVKNIQLIIMEKIGQTHRRKNISLIGQSETMKMIDGPIEVQFSKLPYFDLAYWHQHNHTL